MLFGSGGGLQINIFWQMWVQRRDFGLLLDYDNLDQIPIEPDSYLALCVLDPGLHPGGGQRRAWQRQGEFITIALLVQI